MTKQRTTEEIEDYSTVSEGEWESEWVEGPLVEREAKVVYQLRLDRADVDRLRAEADRRGVGPSTLARDLVLAGLAEKRPVEQTIELPDLGLAVLVQRMSPSKAARARKTASRRTGGVVRQGATKIIAAGKSSKATGSRGGVIRDNAKAVISGEKESKTSKSKSR
jgi:hypothetical protein